MLLYLFFLSGYGLYESYKNKVCNYKGILIKIKKLYIKYWQVFIIVIPITILLHCDIIINLKTLLLNLTAIEITYCGEWGFISFYIILILLFPILKRLIDKYNINIIYYFIIISIINAFAYIILPSILNNEQNSIILNNKQAFDYLPTFITGILCSKYNVLNYIKSLKNNIFYLIISIIILISVIVFRYYIGSFLDYIFSLLFIISITYLLKYNFLSKLLINIGKESMNIWLIHTFYCYKWCPNIIYYPKYSILIFLFLLLISYLTSIFIKYIYKYLKKVLI